METNRPWNWRLIVPNTIKMTLVRPPMTNFKMTVRADCAVSACSPLTVSIKTFAPWLSGPPLSKGVSLWTGVHPPPTLVAGIQNKANFPFHQPGLFIGFWTASSRTPLSITLQVLTPLTQLTPSSENKFPQASLNLCHFTPQIKHLFPGASLK